MQNRNDGDNQAVTELIPRLLTRLVNGFVGQNLAYSEFLCIWTIESLDIVGVSLGL